MNEQHCCYVGNTQECPNNAEWEICREGGAPHDDYTQVCTEHVGVLLFPEGNAVFPVQDATSR